MSEAATAQNIIDVFSLLVRYTSNNSNINVQVVPIDPREELTDEYLGACAVKATIPHDKVGEPAITKELVFDIANMRGRGKTFFLTTENKPRNLDISIPASSVAEVSEWEFNFDKGDISTFTAYLANYLFNPLISDAIKANLPTLSTKRPQGHPSSGSPAPTVA